MVSGASAGVGQEGCHLESGVCRLLGWTQWRRAQRGSEASHVRGFPVWLGRPPAESLGSCSAHSTDPTQPQPSQAEAGGTLGGGDCIAPYGARERREIPAAICEKGTQRKIRNSNTEYTGYIINSILNSPTPWLRHTSAHTDTHTVCQTLNHCLINSLWNQDLRNSWVLPRRNVWGLSIPKRVTWKATEEQKGNVLKIPES